MFGNFLIGLREGLEASLVVCILIAYLVKTGNRRQLPPLWAGVALAVALSLAFGALLQFGSSTLTFRAKEALGGTLSILSVALVTWMVFWMRRTARHLKSELQDKLDAALAVGTGALVVTSFFAVGREGLETSLFIWTAVQATQATASAPSSAPSWDLPPPWYWAGSSTRAPCASTWPSSSAGRAPCSSSSQPASSPTASTTSRKPTSCPA